MKKGEVKMKRIRLYILGIVLILAFSGCIPKQENNSLLIPNGEVI
jgi:hypothetical protein